MRFVIILYVLLRLSVNFSYTEILIPQHFRNFRVHSTHQSRSLCVFETLLYLPSTVCDNNENAQKLILLPNNNINYSEFNFSDFHSALAAVRKRVYRWSRCREIILSHENIIFIIANQKLYNNTYNSLMRISFYRWNQTFLQLDGNLILSKPNSLALSINVISYTYILLYNNYYIKWQPSKFHGFCFEFITTTEVFMHHLSVQNWRSFYIIATL